MRIPSVPSSVVHYVFTLTLIGCALSVPSTSSNFGPSPSQSTQSLVNSAKFGLTCKGSDPIEHLTGECMSQHACSQQSGVSIGPCTTHQGLSTCCLLKSSTVQSKQTWHDHTVMLPYLTVQQNFNFCKLLFVVSNNPNEVR